MTTADSRLPISTVRRYAYINVLVSFLIWGFALGGLSMMMPVMYKAISEQMGWTITQTTSFMVIKSGVAAVAGLLVGKMFLKFGLKRIFTVAVMVIGLATASLYFANTLPVYYALGAVSGFAGMICAVSFQVTLARWFSGSLGRIVGIALLGGALAGLIVPMGVTWLLGRVGWQGTAAIGGLSVAVILSLVVLLFLRESPEAYGYTAEELDPPKVKGGAKPAAPKPGDDFSDVVKSPRFALVLLAVFASGAFSNGINEHTPLFLSKQASLGPYMAAAGLASVLVISSVGKILFGWLFDRVSTRGIALCWFLCGIAVLTAFPVTGLVTFLIFTFTRGMAQGGVVVENPILARHMFGLRPLSQVMAFLFAAFQLGAAFGIWAIGFGFDRTGSYTVPFLCAAIAAFATAALALTFHPECWPGYRSNKAGEKAALA